MSEEPRLASWQPHGLRERAQLRAELARAAFLRWIQLAPARVVPAVYVVAWMVGTCLLALPASSRAGQVGWWEAAFTAMSALCITGLGVVDPQAWTGLGQVIILGLIQVGGFGIMTMASMIMFGLLGTSSRRAASLAVTETRADHRDIARIPRRIAVLSLTVEGVIALVLALRLAVRGADPLEAVWEGVFHAVSAFNNAGFGLYPDSLASFGADPFIMVPVCAAVVIGGIGFPVYLELLDRWRGRRVRRLASVHLRLTLMGTVALLVLGWVAVALCEWGNPATLGQASWSGRVLGALGGTVFPRTAGFASFDYADATEPTILLTDALMMIGGGSASTAGGLKITTVALLAVTVAAEVMGEEDTVVAGRRVSRRAIRQALAVAVLGVVLVAAATVAMSVFDGDSVERLSFEAVSAMSNTGLTMGLTPTLSRPSWAVLMVLMLLGRVGPVTAVAALTLRTRRRRFTYPEEDPLIG